MAIGGATPQHQQSEHQAMKAIASATTGIASRFGSSSEIETTHLHSYYIVGPNLKLVVGPPCVNGRVASGHLFVF